MVKHAHAREDKELRREAILRASLTLFLEDTRRLPAVAAIAGKAGLAKGTVYLYFRTKEEIFAALLSQEWDGVLREVELSLVEEAGSQQATVARFITKFADFLASHPYFLALDSLGYGHLEANLPLAEFWQFKHAFSSAINRTAGVLDEALSLTSGTGMRLLVRTYALTRGLWQTLDLPDRLGGAERLHDDPVGGMEFDTELRAALQEYWRGALARES